MFDIPPKDGTMIPPIPPSDRRRAFTQEKGEMMKQVVKKSGEIVKGGAKGQDTAGQVQSDFQSIRNIRKRLFRSAMGQ